MVISPRSLHSMASRTFYGDSQAHTRMTSQYSQNSKNFVKSFELVNSKDVEKEDNRNNSLNEIINNNNNNNHIINSDENKIFKLVSRRIRRKLDQESRISKAVRSLSSGKSSKKKSQKYNSLFNSNISLPWIDSSLWTSINSVHGNPLPNVQPKISREEVIRNDKECCKSYLSDMRSIRNCWFSCFCTAALHAAVDLGLCSFHKRDKWSVLSLSDSVEITSKDTNSGTPLMIKKNDPRNKAWIKKCLRNIFEKPSKGKIRNIFTSGLTFEEKGSLEQKLFELPQMLFRRFQISTTDKDEFKIKPRVVWCVPHIVVALEAIFFHSPLQHCLNSSQNDSSYPYSIGQSNRLISNSISSFRKNTKYFGEGRKIYSLDYSKFDRTIPLWFFDIFFAIVESNYEFSSHEKQVYDTLRLYIKYTPMVVDGKLVFKSRGISSGLFITNLFDTLFNLTLLKMTELFYNNYNSQFSFFLNVEKSIFQLICDHKEFQIYSYNKNECLRVLGDDGIVLWYPVMLQFLEKICFNLGMKISVKNITDDPKHGDIFYLGRFWDSDNLPFQTERYIAGHIVFRSKFYNKNEIDFDLEDLDCMRILSICLPLRNGKEFINKYLKEYKPLVDFKNKRKDFYLLKDWPYDNYRKFKFDEIDGDILNF